MGMPISIGSPFTFSAGSTTWKPMTVNTGGVVALVPGGHYVMAVTVAGSSTLPAEFEEVVRYTPIPADVDGNGGLVWLNSGLLTTQPWSTWGDVGDLGFTANFTVVVPEPSPLMILAVAVLALAAFWKVRILG